MFGFSANKVSLIGSGLVEDKPMTLPNGDISEVTYGDEAVRQIIIMDESQHPFRTDVDRGGSRSMTYGTDLFCRQGQHGTHGARHTTGIYAFNASGKTLPPLYIFDSTAKDEEHFQMKSSWVKGLPMVNHEHVCL